MKRIILWITALLIGTTGCSTIQQNIDARKNLTKCKYEYDRIELRKVEIGDLQLQTLDFNVYVKITNNSPTDVALDKVEGDLLLDEYKTLNLSHKKFIRIKPKESKSEPIVVHIPFRTAMKNLGHRPENLTVKAKLYMTVMIGEKNITSPYPFEAEKTFPIPWDQINAELKKQGGKLEEKAEDLKKKAKDEINKRIKFKKPF